jgi:hypothetical protein
MRELRLRILLIFRCLTEVHHVLFLSVSSPAVVLSPVSSPYLYRFVLVVEEQPPDIDTDVHL